MTDIELWLLYNNIWNHLTMCKKKLKNIIYKSVYNIPQNSSCKATNLRSLKPSKKDEQDMWLLLEK